MRRDWLICLLLSAITLLVFWPVTSHEFINYDDPLYVTENPHVQAGLTQESIAWAFGRVTGEGTYWHPLTWLSHMLDCQLFGLKAGRHHLTNLLFHTANVLLLFLALRRMTGAPWRSAVVAGLFALHPLQVDTVAWIAERKNVLSTLFWMLTLLAYEAYARRPSITRYTLVFTALALGLMCKPMLVTVPCLLLVLDYWPLSRIHSVRVCAKEPQRREERREKNEDSGPQPNHPLGTDLQAAQTGLSLRSSRLCGLMGLPSIVWSRLRRIAEVQPGSVSPEAASYPRYKWPRLLLEKMPLLGLAAVSSAVTVMAHQRLGLLPTGEQLPLSSRVEHALVAYAGYLEKIVWPVDLAVFYPHPGTWPSERVLLSALLLAGITVLAGWWARKRPYLIAGWLWFLGTLVPVIGLVQAGTQSMADRFAYVPIIGVCILAVWGLAELLQRAPFHRIIMAGTAGAVLCACGIATRRQVGYWQDSETLFGHTVRVTRDNFVALLNYGVGLGEHGKLEEAVKQYEEALRVNPGYPQAERNLGNALALQGKLEAAIPHYAAALKSKPDYAEAEYNWGSALALEGKQDEAEGHFLAALRLSPDYAEAHNSYGNLLVLQGRMDHAIAEYRAAIRAKPDYAEAHCFLGRALARQKQFGEAVTEFRATLKAKPDHLAALNDLAWILATAKDEQIRNVPEAIQLAERACRLSPKGDALYLDTLAVADSEAGQFAGAVEASEKALRLAEEAKDDALAAQLRAHRNAFREGHSYRQAFGK